MAQIKGKVFDVSNSIIALFKEIGHHKTNLEDWCFKLYNKQKSRQESSVRDPPKDAPESHACISRGTKFYRMEAW